LVRVLTELKEYVEAESVVLSLLRLQPDRGHLYALYAHVMLLTLNLEKAEALVRESLRLDADNQLAKTLDVMLSVAKDNTPDAEQRLAEMISTHPESLHVVWSWVIVLESKGRYGEALELARQVLRVRPQDADLVDTVIGLKTLSHWTMLPLWPNVRWGWIGAGAIWLAGVGLINLARLMHEVTAALVFAGVFVTYVIYSWVWPPLLKRWLARRGF
jgi:tetratricopeptide (TPR) repeat protein